MDEAGSARARRSSPALLPAERAALGGPRPGRPADPEVVMDRLEARHRACGECGGEALLLGRHGAGEACDAVPHVDVDARVAQLRAAFERLSHRALDALVVRLHGLLLRRRNHLEPVSRRASRRAPSTRSPRPPPWPPPTAPCRR